MLQLKNFNVYFEDRLIVKNFTFASEDKILNICGKNNSGKTILIEALLGLIEHNGQIFFNNVKINSLICAFPTLIYIGHARSISNYLTVLETLKLWSSLYSSNYLINEAIKFWELQDILNIQISELSSGTIKKVELAKLICCKSNLWILDEPNVNLDNNTKKKLENLIKNYNQNIIITSHNNIYNNYLQL